METIKDLTSELISWLDSECPAVAPPLEPYDNSDLSHNFCELLRIRLDEIFRVKQSELSRLKDEGEGYRTIPFEISDETWKKLTPIERMKFKGLLLKKNPAEQSDKLTAEWWKKIERDFIEWDNATHSNASQRQILDWFHSQFVGEKVTDEMIEKYFKQWVNPRIKTNDVQYEKWLNQYLQELIDSAIEGAKALRDGLIK